jgi:fibronectin-binding autotransporter adhesin
VRGRASNRSSTSLAGLALAAAALAFAPSAAAQTLTGSDGANASTDLTNGGTVTGTAGGDGGAAKSGTSFTLSITHSGSATGGTGGTGGGNFSDSVTLAAGAGGAGGAGVTGSSFTVTNSGSITGGTGGTGGGGEGDSNTVIGGAGGAGGVAVNGTGFVLTNNGSINGGTGGTGGGIVGDNNTITVGNGGGGGIAVSGTGFTLVNNGSISGGTSGPGGGGVGLNNTITYGHSGAGGAAVSGSGFTLTNTGSISGGSGSGSGSGGVGIVSTGSASVVNSGSISGGNGSSGQVDAIDFSGGGNTLSLQNGYSVTGNVISTSGNTAGGDTLALGGSRNATFDASQIVASNPGSYGGLPVYAGFENYVKTGSSTWTLTGSTSAVTSWTISAGTLNVGADTALGAASGSLTFTGGTLQLGASFNLSSRRGITLGTGGGTIDTNGFSTTIAQAVTGSGGLTKAGAGTLTLSASNSYTGGTMVSGGTLQLSGAGTLGSGLLTLSGGTLDLGGTSQTQNGGLTLTGGTIQNGTLSSPSSFAVQAGTITTALAGSGGLTKTGSGTVILDGLNTYTGGTTVSAGTLEIGDNSNPGASVAGDVTVAAGGTLAGHGTVEGDLSNAAGGTVSPGGTVGTLTVGGNYTQGSSSTLHIEVSPTAASKLNVSGSASLAGTLALVYDPGVYSKASYDILHAGSVSGTFTTVSGDAPAGFGQSVSYTATDVDLALDPVTVAPTNDTVLSALGTTALLNAQQATTTLFGHLAALHSGTGSETIHTALASTAPTQVAFNGSAQSLNGMLPGLPDAMASMGGWFRAIGDFASLSGSSSMPGFDTRSGGFLAGIDRPIGEHVTAGAALGFSHTDVGASGNSGTLETPRLFLYASYGAGPWAFDATIGYAYDSIGATRPIAALGETASSSHDGQEATGALQATRRFVLDGVALLPAAGLQYAHLFEGGYSESGASGFDLAVSSRNADSLRPFAGMSAAKAFATDNGAVLIPEADLAYSHEMFNTPPSLVSVGGGSFTVDGLVPSRDEVTIGGGVTARMSERLALYADYHAVLPTGNLFEQTVSAGLSYRF